jgi:CheY-like chemotaxis protein
MIATKTKSKKKKRDLLDRPILGTVLLVDDVDASRLAAKWFLEGYGYAVDSARSAEQALALFDPRVHDIIVTDNTMSWMSGSEMAQVVRARSPQTPVIMYTGNPPQDLSCVDLVIPKPAHLLVVKEALDSALRARRGPPPAR